MFDELYITHYGGAYFSPDPAGQVIKMIQRPFACFIVTVKGLIRFEYEGGSIDASPAQSIFLPAGFSYTNRCLQDAQSYVFNFQTALPYSLPAALAPLSADAARVIFDKVTSSGIPYARDHLAIMAELYTLATLLQKNTDACGGKDDPLRRSTEYMTAHYGNKTLTNGEIAEACFISEVYLRKLFVQKMRKTPHAVLTEVRMKQAALLLSENYSVKEVALRVGYGDAAQFCRAYKRYFGHTPGGKKVLFLKP